MTKTTAVRQIFHTTESDEIVFDTVPEVKRNPMQDTLFFVDWDDTCFPSTYVNLNLHAPNRTLHIPGWSEMEDMLIQAFDTMQKHGKVCIVTNADQGWVERSAQKTLRRLWRQQLCNIDIVSAKAAFRCGDSKPWQWKYDAFRHLIKTHSPAQCISFGDSNSERYALKKISEAVVKKSVKFALRPCVRLVTSQWRELLKHVDFINATKKALDMSLVAEKTFSLV